MEREICFGVFNLEDIRDTMGIQDMERAMKECNEMIHFRNIKLGYERSSITINGYQRAYIRWYMAKNSANFLSSTASRLHGEEITEGERSICARTWILKKIYKELIFSFRGKKMGFYGILEPTKLPIYTVEILHISEKLTMKKIPYDELRQSRDDLHREFTQYFYSPSRIRFFSDDD